MHCHPCSRCNLCLQPSTRGELSKHIGTVAKPTARRCPNKGKSAELDFSCPQCSALGSQDLIVLVECLRFDRKGGSVGSGELDTWRHVVKPLTGLDGFRSLLRLGAGTCLSRSIFSRTYFKLLGHVTQALEKPTARKRKRGGHHVEITCFSSSVSLNLGKDCGRECPLPSSFQRLHDILFLHLLSACKRLNPNE